MCPEVDSASKVSTRDFSWGKGGRWVWLTTYHPCSAETSRQSRALIYPEPLGPLRPVAGQIYFTFYFVTSKGQNQAPASLNLKNSPSSIGQEANMT